MVETNNKILILFETVRIVETNNKILILVETVFPDIEN